MFFLTFVAGGRKRQQAERGRFVQMQTKAKAEPSNWLEALFCLNSAVMVSQEEFRVAPHSWGASTIDGVVELEHA